jgi:hypothetical protein
VIIGDYSYTQVLVFSVKFEISILKLPTGHPTAIALLSPKIWPYFQTHNLSSRKQKFGLDD